MARGDWVPCRGYGELGLATPVAPQHVILVRHGDSILAPAEESVVEETDDIVVNRVVGQVAIRSADTPTFVCLRIRVGLYDDTLDQVAFYASSLFAGPDANEPFLWQRYIEASANWSILANFSPAWSMIDSRVSRRLSRDQALVLTIETVSVNVDFIPWLRSWAHL